MPKVVKNAKVACLDMDLQKARMHMGIQVGDSLIPAMCSFSPAYSSRLACPWRIGCLEAGLLCMPLLVELGFCALEASDSLARMIWGNARTIPHGGVVRLG